MAMAAIVLSESQPDLAEKTLTSLYDTFWLGNFIDSIRRARARVPNADACAMMELLHVIRDNINFDLRDTFPAWFKDYPVIHLMAHYPPPWPASENEFRIPADREIQKSGPDLTKATLSRAAELSMVAYDSNASETQLLQGFLMNDRFVMRGTYGIPYEFLWANPYQPGLSYYHVPLAQHDEIGGQLYVRSTWEDDAAWIGFFEGQLQLFSEGAVSQVDARAAHEPMDIEEATVFFGARCQPVPRAEAFGRRSPRRCVYSGARAEARLSHRSRWRGDGGRAVRPWGHRLFAWAAGGRTGAAWPG